MASDSWAAMAALLEGPDVLPDHRYDAHNHSRDVHYGSRVGAAIDTTPVIQVDLASVEWQADAACQGADVEAFFKHGPPDAATARMCAHCPVAAECLQYALDRPDLVGYWGGTSDTTRRRLRRRRRKVAP